ncbi:MAG: hypothetical protein IJY28_04260 [Clostridia bacterium]|nr:hypothetical protein [Clostridia bacterium]
MADRMAAVAVRAAWAGDPGLPEVDSGPVGWAAAFIRAGCTAGSGPERRCIIRRCIPGAAAEAAVDAVARWPS